MGRTTPFPSKGASLTVRFRTLTVTNPDFQVRMLKPDLGLRSQRLKVWTLINSSFYFLRHNLIFGVNFIYRSSYVIIFIYYLIYLFTPLFNKNIFYRIIICVYEGRSSTLIERR